MLESTSSAQDLSRLSRRSEYHPLIVFRLGAAGRIEPMLIGTRLKVRQVVATVAGSLDAADAADALGIPSDLVVAAMAYYAQFRAEVDLDIAWAEEFDETEFVNWLRQQDVPD